MRVMGLDIGERRIGVASGDTTSGIATPLRVMQANEVLANARPWKELVADIEPELIVCGLPKTLGGAQGAQARRVREVAQAIAGALGLELVFADERLSSSEAKRYLRAQGLSSRDMRGKVDSVAASLILETWLSAQTQGIMEER